MVPPLENFSRSTTVIPWISDSHRMQGSYDSASVIPRSTATQSWRPLRMGPDSIRCFKDFSVTGRKTDGFLFLCRGPNAASIYGLYRKRDDFRGGGEIRSQFS